MTWRRKIGAQRGNVKEGVGAVGKGCQGLSPQRGRCDVQARILESSWKDSWNSGCDSCATSADARQQTARLPQDLPFEFQRHQLRRHMRRGQSKVADQLVFGQRTGPQAVENAGM